jgi:hypothetical protein
MIDLAIVTSRGGVGYEEPWVGFGLCAKPIDSTALAAQTDPGLREADAGIRIRADAVAR